MQQWARSTRIWFRFVALAAVLATGYDLLHNEGVSLDIAALVLLGLSAAIAHLFPIKAADNQTSYRLTNIFLVAGAIILPPALYAPLGILALTPESWWSKRQIAGFRARFNASAVRWFSNVPVTVLAIHVAGYWMHFWQVGRIHNFRDLAVVLAAAALLTLTQNLIIGIGMALNFKIPLYRIDTLSITALQGDGFFGIIGLVVAGLWLTERIQLLLVLPILFLAHRLTANAHLARLAQVDAKTGLHNSRYFEKALEDEVAHSTRIGRSMALLFLDLDRFKRVNDTYGHATGDLVLREFATILTNSFRKGDIVARFGGEEFAVILPGTDALEALYLAELARQAVETHAFKLADSTTLRCTTSIGIALAPTDGKTPTDLLAAADRAMYEAKKTRNTVARYSPGSDLPSPTMTLAVHEEAVSRIVG